MNNQQLLLDFTEIKTLHVVRYCDTRSRDSEGHYAIESGDDGNTEERLREQLHILRINSSIWLADRDKQIVELKQELKKYKV